MYVELILSSRPYSQLSPVELNCAQFNIIYSQLSKLNRNDYAH